MKELSKSFLSDAHYKLLAESSVDMIFMLNEAGDFIYVNPAASDITGYTEKELLGMSFSGLLRPDNKDSTLKFYANQVSEKKTSTYLEIPLIKKDGTQVWIGQNVSIEELEKGMEMTGTARDISKKIKNEKQQHKKIAKLLVLMENLQEGVLVEDENRKITFVNRAFCDLFSVTLIPEDLIGRDYTNAFNHIKRLFADPEKFAKQEHSMVANKSIRLVELLELNDGRIYERDYVPIYIETSYSGNLWKYRDTTEKNRMKSELVKSERKYKSVIDTMQLGLLEVDKNDKILSANDSFCKILGYGSIDELIGKPAFETLLDEEQQEIMKNQVAERTEGKSNTYEIKAKRADGASVWMLINGAPLFDNHDNVIGSVGVHLDISYQKKLHIELEEKKALKGMMEWQEKVMDQLEEKILERTSKVLKQKEIIEYKNSQITQSINYALRIQQALLPHTEELKEVLSEFLIMYKPKDIVSGDFFYFSKSSDSTCYLAAVDSTGHGVPGGFMSMLGYEKLNDAITKEKLPGDILSVLNKSIKMSLRHTTNLSVSDGFDIALCAIDVKSNVLHYAGAHRPIWIIRKGSDQIEEIKANKAAIGGWTDELQVFETHRIQLAKGDTFYLFTDGFVDQFGTSNKRLLSNRFKELLLANQDKSLVEQQAFLENYLQTWQGNEEQTDDILVIGVRL